MTPAPELSEESVKIVALIFGNKVTRMVLLKILAQDGINITDLTRALSINGVVDAHVISSSLATLVQVGMISMEDLGHGLGAVRQYHMTEFGRSFFKHVSLFCEQVDLCLLRRDVDKILAPYTKRQQLEVILDKAQEKILQAESEGEADGQQN